MCIGVCVCSRWLNLPVINIVSPTTQSCLAAASNSQAHRVKAPVRSSVTGVRQHTHSGVKQAPTSSTDTTEITPGVQQNKTELHLRSVFSLAIRLYSTKASANLKGPSPHEGPNENWFGSELSKWWSGMRCDHWEHSYKYLSGSQETSLWLNTCVCVCVCVKCCFPSCRCRFCSFSPLKVQTTVRLYLYYYNKFIY